MTVKEWKEQIGNETNLELLKDLVDFGCDNYYYDLWRVSLKELCKRLDVDFKQLGIGN